MVRLIPGADCTFWSSPKVCHTGVHSWASARGQPSSPASRQATLSFCCWLHAQGKILLLPIEAARGELQSVELRPAVVWLCCALQWCGCAAACSGLVVLRYNAQLQAWLPAEPEPVLLRWQKLQCPTYQRYSDSECCVNGILDMLWAARGRSKCHTSVWEQPLM